MTQVHIVTAWFSETSTRSTTESLTILGVYLDRDYAQQQKQALERTGDFDEYTLETFQAV